MEYYALNTSLEELYHSSKLSKLFALSFCNEPSIEDNYRFSSNEVNMGKSGRRRIS